MRTVMWLMDQDLRDQTQASIPLYAPVADPATVRRAEVRRESLRTFMADLVDAIPDPDGARVRAAAAPGSQLNYEYRLVQLAGLLERATGAVIPMVAQEAPIAIAEGDSKRLDTQPGAYYTTAQHNGNTVPLAGPYHSHGQALLAVAPARDLVLSMELRRAFGPDVAFGTSRSEHPQGPGLLNDRLSLGFAPQGTYCSPAEDEEPMRKYLVAVTYERWTEADYSAGEPSDRGYQHEAAVVDEDDLRQLSRRYGFSEPGASSPDRTNSFRSTHPDETREHFERGVDAFYTLHVHAVDGRDADPEAIQGVADLLGIRFDRPWLTVRDSPEP